MIRLLQSYVRAQLRIANAHPIPDAPILSAGEYERQFAANNALGLTLDQARSLAERELQYGPSPGYPGYSFGLSTGTSGPPGVFITNRREREAWLGSFLARCFRWRELAGARVALLLKHDNRLYQEANRGRWLQLRHFSLGQPIAGWARELERFQPTILVAPPSALLALPADLDLRPRVILAGAEVLLPQHAVRIEQRFGVRPRVVYQAREGFLAVSCEKGMLHWNADLLTLEREPLVRGRFVPVLTDRTRETQRYVRYRLEDCLLEGSCTCGNPFPSFAMVEGRLGDVIQSGHGGPIYPLEINAVLLAAGCEDYELVQSGDREFALSTEHVGDWGALEELLGGNIRQVAPTSQPLTVKRRPVRRAMSS
jgi:putative adenylate-forming enzyme